MPELTVNAKRIDVPLGSTLLDAARACGLEIPTLCFRDGCAPWSSCMVCVVKDVKAGKLVPSCTAPALKDMVIETDTDEVHEARRTALELLLGEHVGDCEGPCHRICPAHMNIPLMIRQIAAGRLEDAIATVKRDIALPAILGRICPAPCERGCRRGVADGPVSICLLKRFVADADLAGAQPYEPAVADPTGHSAAVVGAGPAGLAAAWHLRRAGIACTVFEKESLPGGALRAGPGEDRLPHEVIDPEVEAIRALGVDFRMETCVGADVSMDDLRRDFDAVIVATGAREDEPHAPFGLETSARGIKAARPALSTSIEGVFAAGSAVSPTRMAVRALADGEGAALCVVQFLNGQAVTGEVLPFNSSIGRLADGEIDEFLKGADPCARIEPASSDEGFSRDEAAREARRCLHCDCRKIDSCILRDLAASHGAEANRYKGAERLSFTRDVTHPFVIYEPGKCIRCGLCVQITAREADSPGLTFVGRGFGVQVGVPLSGTLAQGLGKAARECVEACPTGALSFYGKEAPE